MKKPIIMAVTLATAVSLVGACEASNSQANVAKNLDYNLNVLSATVNKLDTIDNNYIQNPDIYSTANEDTLSSDITNIDTMSTSPKQEYRVQYLVGSMLPNSVSNDELRKNKFVPRYDNQTNMLGTNTLDNGSDLSQDKVRPLPKKLTGLKSTDRQNKEKINGSQVSNLGDNTCLTPNCTDNTCTSNTLTNLLTKEIIEKYCSDCGIEVNDTVCKNCGTAITSPDCATCGNDNKTLYNLLYSAIKSNSANTTTTPSTISQVKSRNVNYKPRYVSSTTKTSIDTGTNLDAYLDKVEELYTMTSDVIVANDTFGDKKEALISTINEVKELTECLKNGECKPSDQQLQALSNYVYDLRTSNNRIKSNNGALTNELRNINKTSNFGLSKSIDLINSNYLRILNQLDVRITYLNNALSTLDQVRYLLLETMVNDTIDGNEDITIDIVIDGELPIDQDISNEDDNTIVEDNTIEDDTSDNDDQIIEDGIVDNTDTDTNDTDILDNEDTGIDTTIDTNDTIDTNNVDDDLVINNEVVSEGIPDSSVTNNKTNTSLLDTYNNNLYGNLDLDKNKVKNDTYDIENNNNAGETNSATNQNNNENIDNDDNIDNDINTTNETIDSMNTDTQNNNLNNTNGNNLNNGVANTNMANTSNGIAGGGFAGNNIIGQENSLGYGIEQNHNDINTPNGTFQNGIIYQNNLNNGVNNGANGLGTGYNGSSGMYDENNKNINTYGFNTMVDMLNRGTVNNGINTLELTEKPVMVNN